MSLAIPNKEAPKKKSPEGHAIVVPFSVEDLLRHFLSEEVLEGDNLFACAGCGKKAKAITQLSLEKVKWFMVGKAR